MENKTIYCQTALSLVNIVRDILDKLNLSIDYLEKIQYDLDENYDALNKNFSAIMDPKLKLIVDQLMTQMAKLNMEISDKIVDLKHLNNLEDKIHREINSPPIATHEEVAAHMRDKFGFEAEGHEK